MVVKTYASSIQGIDAARVTVEVSLQAGTKYFMVGLPDLAVKEAWHRVESSIKHIGYHLINITATDNSSCIQNSHSTLVNVSVSQERRNVEQTRCFGTPCPEEMA